MSVQILQLSSAYIQFMESEVSMQTPPPQNSLIKNWLEVLALLIINYHIVQNNTAHHDVCDSV